MSNPNAIEKTLFIMKAFTEPPYEYTAKELSVKLSISKPTVHRILNTLEENNFIKRASDVNKYTVGYESYIVGMQYAKKLDVYSEIREIVDNVAKNTGQQVGYAVMEGESVIGIYESKNFNNLIKYIPGEVYTVNCGVYGMVLMSYSHDLEDLKEAVDKLELKPVTPRAIIDKDALLSQYKKIRRLGYATSDGEHIEGTLGIGAPTFYSSGKIHGCIGLSGIKSDTFIKNWSHYLDELLKGAEKISRLLI